MISARYAAQTALIVAVALVPTTIHTYIGSTAIDGLSTGSVPSVLDGMHSTDTLRRPAWVKENLDSDDWIERVYHTTQGDVTLFVGRSYDAKRLYHHPELALLRGTETEPAGVGHAAARPEIPLHLLHTRRNGREGIGVYALLYDGRYIQDPVWFQIRTAAENVIGARKPMTLFLASDSSGRPPHLDDAAATRVLLAAMRSFEQQEARK